MSEKNNFEIEVNDSSVEITDSAPTGISAKSVFEIGDYRFVELYNDPLCPLCTLPDDQKKQAFELYIDFELDSVKFSKHNPFGVMAPDDVDLHFRNHYRPVPKKLTPEVLHGKKIGLQDLVANDDFRIDVYWIALINDLISGISELKAKKQSLYTTTGEVDQRLEKLLVNKERLLFEALDELSKLEANVIRAVDFAFDQMLHSFKQRVVKALKDYASSEVKTFPVEYRKRILSLLDNFWSDLATALDIAVSDARVSIKKQFSSKM